MESSIPFLNRCISFVAFVSAVTLVVYMLVVIVTGTYDVVQTMTGMFMLDTAERQVLFKALNTEFLHTVAVLLILMKAYRVLVEYMQHHHIDIKYLVEVAVIVCVLELLFNYQSYAMEMRYILLALGVTFLGLYVYGYDTLMRSSRDSIKEASRD